MPLRSQLLKEAGSRAVKEIGKLPRRQLMLDKQLQLTESREGNSENVMELSKAACLVV